MKLIKCYTCKKIKKEIEFEYLFFSKEYKKDCKKCDKKITNHKL